MSFTVSRVRNKSVVNGSTFSRITLLLFDPCQEMKWQFLIAQIVTLSLCGWKLTIVNISFSNPWQNFSWSRLMSLNLENKPYITVVIADVVVVKKKKKYTYKHCNIQCRCPAYQTDTEQTNVWTPNCTGGPWTCGRFTLPVDVVYVSLPPRTR